MEPEVLANWLPGKERSALRRLTFSPRIGFRNSLTLVSSDPESNRMRRTFYSLEMLGLAHTNLKAPADTVFFAITDLGQTVAAILGNREPERDQRTDRDDSQD